MGVSHGRSHVADLAFQVFSRSIHPEWFAVREFRRLTRERWEADLRVIEGGHAITFRAGSIRLTEVLAGRELVLPESGMLYHAQVRHEQLASFQPGGGVEYQTSFEAERVDPEVFQHLNDEMCLDATCFRLFHRFAPPNRMSPAPITHLRYEATPRGLLVHIFHSFPEERAIVRTQSLIEVR